MMFAVYNVPNLSIRFDKNRFDDHFIMGLKITDYISTNFFAQFRVMPLNRYDLCDYEEELDNSKKLRRLIEEGKIKTSDIFNADIENAEYDGDGMYETIFTFRKDENYKFMLKIPSYTFEKILEIQKELYERNL